jgi:anti-anti-sigma regulatory factor
MEEERPELAECVLTPNPNGLCMTMIATSKNSEPAVRHCPICGSPFDSQQAISSDSRCPSCHNLLWCTKRSFSSVAVLDVISGQTPEHLKIQQLWDALLRSGCGGCVIVNLAEVKRGNSELISRLITLKKLVEASGGRLILCGMHRPVREILSHTRLDRLFEMFGMETDAIDAACPTS